MTTPYRETQTRDVTEIEKTKIHETAETARKRIEEREVTRRKALECRDTAGFLVSRLAFLLSLLIVAIPTYYYATAAAHPEPSQVKLCDESVTVIKSTNLVDDHKVCVGGGTVYLDKLNDREAIVTCRCPGSLAAPATSGPGFVPIAR